MKYSLKLEENTLKLTEVGGRYMLKPIPIGRFQNLKIAPENEHLRMKIASRVFKIETAKNTLIYFENAQPSYLVECFYTK